MTVWAGTIYGVNKMELKEAQEILKQHNFTLNEWRYTDDGNRVYEQFLIGHLKEDKSVYLVLSVWVHSKKINL